MMKFIDALGQGRGVAVVQDDVVGERASLIARRLCAHDCHHLGLCQMIASDDARKLQFLRAIDEQHPREIIPSTALDQQWNADQTIGSVSRSNMGAHPFTNQGMQDRFELAASGLVGEHQPPQRGPIERSAGFEDGLPESGDDVGQSTLAWLNDFAGNDIGIDDDDAMTLGESPTHQAFARADAAGHANHKWCGHKDGPLWNSAMTGSRQNIAMIPAPAR